MRQVPEERGVVRRTKSLSRYERRIPLKGTLCAAELGPRRMPIVMKDSSIYPHPFSGSYWKTAAKEFSSLRSVCYAALLCAIAIVLEQFQIPVTQSLFISVSFLAISLCSMITGPVMAVPCGVIVDLIGYALHPTGPFFPGYTLTAVLSAMIYALFLYRAKLTFGRIAGAKAVVNLLINTIVGSVWRVVLYGSSPFLYYIFSSGFKNLLLFPLEVCLICWLFRMLQKPLIHFRAIPEGTDIRMKKGHVAALIVMTLAGVACLVLFLVFYQQITAFLHELFPSKA